MEEKEKKEQENKETDDKHRYGVYSKNGGDISTPKQSEEKGKK